MGTHHEPRIRSLVLTSKARKLCPVWFEYRLPGFSVTHLALNPAIALNIFVSIPRRLCLFFSFKKKFRRKKKGMSYDIEGYTAISQSKTRNNNTLLKLRKSRQIWFEYGHPGISFTHLALNPAIPLNFIFIFVSALEPASAMPFFFFNVSVKKNKRRVLCEGYTDIWPLNSRRGLVTQ
ncbi:hypothetical protein DEU56DRAFT_418740 [Suillus clintonianus]|uniref:uncharacterized protein n=1 Tax=Suillus clintonianus TaxID=1904413 RepID=UPI001B885E22|nr:uncharacterized protein DEU56DRAFT_418740 [Suillus clintonianus]KAG2133295.1 hypothetical protein DEU56DRAFT_418740 [Suillus clintonianus]